MTAAGDAVLAVALGEVGYVEGPNNSTKYWDCPVKYAAGPVDTRGMTTEAKRAAAARRARMLDGTTQVTHGTLTAYTWHGCRCPECTEANRVAHREYVDRKRDQVNKAWVRRYHDRNDAYRAHRLRAMAQLGGACVDCGITDERVLHFDHINPLDKIDAVTKLIRNRVSLSADAELSAPVQAELAKCVLRCANCHTIKTVGAGDQYTGRRRGAA